MCLCCSVSVGSGLATDPQSKESYRLVYEIKKLKKVAKVQKAAQP
jgi:hypothetical protein